jgi:hypothetical protein
MVRLSSRRAWSASTIAAVDGALGVSSAIDGAHAPPVEVLRGRSLALERMDMSGSNVAALFCIVLTGCLGIWYQPLNSSAPGQNTAQTELQRRAPALEECVRRCTPRSSRRPFCADQLSANYCMCV